MSDSSKPWPMYRNPGTRPTENASGPQDPRPDGAGQLTKPALSWWERSTILPLEYKALTMRQVTRALVDEGFVVDRKAINFRHKLDTVRSEAAPAMLQTMLFLFRTFPKPIQADPVLGVGLAQQSSVRPGFVGDSRDAYKSTPVAFAGNHFALGVDNPFIRHPRHSSSYETGAPPQPQRVALVEGATAACVVQKLIAGSTASTKDAIVSAIATHTGSWQPAFPWASEEFDSAFKAGYGDQYRYPLSVRRTADPHNGRPQKSPDQTRDDWGAIFTDTEVFDPYGAIVTAFRAYFHGLRTPLGVAVWNSLYGHHGPEADAQRFSASELKYTASSSVFPIGLKHYTPAHLPVAVGTDQKHNPVVGYSLNPGTHLSPIDPAELCVFEINENKYVLRQTNYPDDRDNSSGVVVIDATSSATEGKPVVEHLSDGRWYVAKGLPIACVAKTDQQWRPYEHHYHPPLQFGRVTEAVELREDLSIPLDPNGHALDLEVAGMDGQSTSLLEDTMFLLDRAKTTRFVPIASIDSNLQARTTPEVSPQALCTAIWNDPMLINHIDPQGASGHHTRRKNTPERLVWQLQRGAFLDDLMLLFPHGAMIAINRRKDTSLIINSVPQTRWEGAKTKYAVYEHCHGQDDIDLRKPRMFVHPDSIKNIASNASLILRDLEDKNNVVNLGATRSVYLIEPSLPFTLQRIQQLGVELEPPHAQRSPTMSIQIEGPGLGR